MKSTISRSFKQIWKDKKTQKEKEYNYEVIIIRDTEDYNYRILNLKTCTIWKNLRFKTFNEAKLYLEKHPHCIKDKKEKIIKLGGRYNEV